MTETVTETALKHQGRVTETVTKTVTETIKQCYRNGDENVVKGAEKKYQTQTVWIGIHISE